MIKRPMQQGFTLIELIVVIIILGILAATALPRFADLQTQARAAKLQGALGAIRGASALFHAQCLAGVAAGATCPANGTAFNIAMEGQNVSGMNQYPAATAAGIISAAGLSAQAVAAVGVDYTFAVAGSVITIGVPSPTPNSCQLTYTEATVAANVITAPPTIVITQSACN